MNKKKREREEGYESLQMFLQGLIALFTNTEEQIFFEREVANFTEEEWKKSREKEEEKIFFLVREYIEVSSSLSLAEKVELHDTTTSYFRFKEKKRVRNQKLILPLEYPKPERCDECGENEVIEISEGRVCENCGVVSKIGSFLSYFSETSSIIEIHRYTRLIHFRDTYRMFTVPKYNLKKPPVPVPLMMFFSFLVKKEKELNRNWTCTPIWIRLILKRMRLLRFASKTNHIMRGVEGRSTFLSLTSEQKKQLEVDFLEVCSAFDKQETWEKKVLCEKKRSEVEEKNKKKRTYFMNYNVVLRVLLWHRMGVECTTWMPGMTMKKTEQQTEEKLKSIFFYLGWEWKE